MSSNLITRSNFFYRLILDTLFRWSKLIDPDEELFWETKLITEGVSFSNEKLVNRKRFRFSSYCQTRAEAENLREKFGGGVSTLLPKHWEPTIDPDQSRVLRIRDQLVVAETDDPEFLAQLRSKNPDRAILSFPPQLAFGTGGHPTTANCLRLLCDARAGHSGDWDFLDLGCGSGILSVAAAHLGVNKAIAVESDHVAIGFAEKNAVRHGVGKLIEFAGEDLVQMLKTPPPERFEVVAANLFSDLLIQIFPLLGQWIAPGGTLIVSGFLTTQAREVQAEAKKCGLPLENFLRRGKWVAGSGIAKSP